ncbi:hypothetical protein Acor_12090 [Acrocarpospora corrugata]|uniref:Uncharacterized protein n=1 Tax=Acrocarpospora corrugata TaxID=35763 RepID=A0A5M3VR44_9ACTN|nr:hypothetical protein [Acrocarpospora corrugata]GER99145.1 hypothetical protein Acor_12090 [Acrocarpospora corrugata]
MNVAEPDEGAVASVRQVLGDGPFAEVGEACVVLTDPTGEHIAVGGSPGYLQWTGRDVGRTTGTRAWHRVGVYAARTLRCRWLLRLRWDVNALAFHPERPILAIGSGSYDGGHMFEGELIILDLDSGRGVSLLDRSREVTQLRWRDGQTLELTMSVRDDDELEELGTSAVATTITLDDWTAVRARSVRVADLPATPVEGVDGTNRATAEAALRAIAAEAGLRRVLRSHVWAVAALADGRVVAGLDRVAAECWTGAGEPLWSLPADGTGCQILVDPGGATATVNSSRGRRWDDSRATIERVGLADGSREPLHVLGHSAVITTDDGGRLAVRDTSHGAHRPTLVFDPSGALVAEVQLGGYDLFNHFLDIRRAPTLLFLKGMGQQSYEDKWVVALDPAGQVIERLFPLEWDADRGGHIRDSPGVFISDAEGDAVIHASIVHNGLPSLPANVQVVRRSYPDGRAQWTHAAIHQVTAVDALDGIVYVSLNSGELLALRATDGHVLGQQKLMVNGHPVVPLSLGTHPPDTVVIGTLDGRILVCQTG